MTVGGAALIAPATSVHAATVIVRALRRKTLIAVAVKRFRCVVPSGHPTPACTAAAAGG